MTETAAASLPVLTLTSTQPVGGLVTFERLTPEQQKEADRLALEVDFTDPRTMMTFGVRPQEAYKDTMLALMKDVKVGDIGVSGDLSIALAKGMDILQIERLHKEVAVPGSWQYMVSRIPLIGRLFSVVYVFAQRQRMFTDMVHEIERQAKTDQRTIIEHNLRLKQHLDACDRNYQDLGVQIWAGAIALERAKVQYETMRQEALATGEALQLSRVHQFHEALIAFDTRLLRMKVAYVRAPLTGQKILAAMQAGRIEFQNLMDSILFDMTALIEAASQVAALYATSRAQDRRARREQVAERINAIGGELLESALTKAKEAQGQGVEEVKRLKAQADQFINLVRKVNDIDARNKELRREAEGMLVDVQRDFTEALKEVGQPAAV